MSLVLQHRVFRFNEGSFGCPDCGRTAKIARVIYERACEPRDRNDVLNAWASFERENLNPRLSQQSSETQVKP